MPDDTTHSIELEFSTHCQEIYEIETSASPSTNNRTYSDSHADTDLIALSCNPFLQKTVSHRMCFSPVGNARPCRNMKMDVLPSQALFRYACD